MNNSLAAGQVRARTGAPDRDEDWVVVGDCYSFSVIRREEVGEYLKGFLLVTGGALLTCACLGALALFIAI